jgi:D-alanine-D-alanine ligase
LDVSRIDVRLDAYGRPHLLEINTLPGMTPDFSDLCILAKAEGLSYTDLILEILYLGASRFDLLSEPVRVPASTRLNVAYRLRQFPASPAA